MKPAIPKALYGGRRNFIGGSDARVIMGSNETALHRPCGEKSAARSSRKTFRTILSSS
jgi:hypothetical protein